MMMSLFSPFNPSSWMNSSILWITMIINMMAVPNKFWMTKSHINLIKKMTIKYMYKQFKSLMTKSMKMNIIIMMTLMIMIMLMNTSSMYPYIYTPTAMPHLCITMALSMWTAINMKKMNNMKKILSTMLPKNTPNPLVPPMIIIETTSMLIQPITLSVRLMANITAGHILVILISSSWSVSTVILSIPTQMMLSFMEMCVAMIQAYVFSMLLIMFNK